MALSAALLAIAGLVAAFLVPRLLSVTALDIDTFLGAIDSAGRGYVIDNRTESVRVVDLDTGWQVSDVPVPGPTPDLPQDLSRVTLLSPDEHTLYVVRSGPSANAVVHAVDVERAEVTSSVEVGQYPWEMSQSGDGTTLFVSNANSNSISVVDVATFTVRSTVDTAPTPTSMVAAPDGRSAYFSGNADYGQPYESVFRVDLVSGAVAEMFRSRIGAVNHVALNASGSRLLVSQLADPQGGGPYGVSIVDLGTDDVVSTIDVDDLGWVRPGPGNDMYILQQSVLTVVDPDVVVIERRVPLGPIGTDDYRTFSADGGTMYVVGADTQSIRSVSLDL